MSGRSSVKGANIKLRLLCGALCAAVVCSGQDTVEESVIAKLNAAITPGGVRIFTIHGQIDGLLETQLDRLAAELIPDAAVAAPVQAVAQTVVP